MTPTPSPVAKDMVWRWANQFAYKLNVSDDKIEQLNREVNDALSDATARGREALEPYCVHDQECILAQYHQGRPTPDGGYEQQFGYGTRQKWYRTSPNDERPKCECGLDAALREGGEG